MINQRDIINKIRQEKKIKGQIQMSKTIIKAYLEKLYIDLFEKECKMGKFRKDINYHNYTKKKWKIYQTNNPKKWK